VDGATLKFTVDLTFSNATYRSLEKGRTFSIGTCGAGTCQVRGDVSLDPIQKSTDGVLQGTGTLLNADPARGLEHITYRLASGEMLRTTVCNPLVDGHVLFTRPVTLGGALYLLDVRGEAPFVYLDEAGNPINCGRDESTYWS